MTWTLLSLTAAVLCFAIKELAAHGKLRWSKGIYGFWDEDGWRRKYKMTWSSTEDGIYGWEYQLHKAPSNWYYKTFKIDYKERWPTSATLTVAFTDGMHLAQAGFKMFLALSFVPLIGWIWAGVIWLTWGIAFTIFYKIFSR